MIITDYGMDKGFADNDIYDYSFESNNNDSLGKILLAKIKNQI